MAERLEFASGGVVLCIVGVNPLGAGPVADAPEHEERQLWAHLGVQDLNPVVGEVQLLTSNHDSNLKLEFPSGVVSLKGQ